VRESSDAGASGPWSRVRFGDVGVELALDEVVECGDRLPGIERFTTGGLHEQCAVDLGHDRRAVFDSTLSVAVSPIDVGRHLPAFDADPAVVER
jgi:hypothetical protein